MFELLENLRYSTWFSCCWYGYCLDVWPLHSTAWDYKNFIHQFWQTKMLYLKDEKAHTSLLISNSVIKFLFPMINMTDKHNRIKVLYGSKMASCRPTHFVPAPVAPVVECPLQGTGGHGFNPGPWQTKVVKNGTSCSSIGLRLMG